eukprot:gene13399-biopygen3629
MPIQGESAVGSAGGGLLFQLDSSRDHPPLDMSPSETGHFYSGMITLKLAPMEAMSARAAPASRLNPTPMVLWPVVSVYTHFRTPSCLVIKSPALHAKVDAIRLTATIKESNFMVVTSVHGSPDIAIKPALEGTGSASGGSVGYYARTGNSSRKLPPLGDL